MSVKKSAFAIALIVAVFVSAACVRRSGEDTRVPAPSTDFVFSAKPSSGILFLSTQLNPVKEAGKMRSVILKDFPGEVDFRPNDNSYLFSQIESILHADPAESILIGALHGDLVALYEKGSIKPLPGIVAELQGREFADSLIQLAKLDGENLFYLPWMQASFVMVANKKALAYLPDGADLDMLSYEQFLIWARNINEGTGHKLVGFPAGTNGLMHRFLQGFLYPSFTASTLLKFKGPDAMSMWSYLKTLWEYVHPGSLAYSTMSEPLLADDVWIAWDHTARLMKAFEEKPDDFIAFPAPSGPKGRGYMVAVSGLSVPSGVGEAKNQILLMDYLTQPVIQDRMFVETGFFPVVATAGQGADRPAQLRSLSAAVEKQTEASDAIPTLIPIGLGESGTSYNRIFMLTFSGIVLEGQDTATILSESAADLQRIIDDANARCWLPDVSDERPCKIE